jgi:autotransporter-associated beta strand protein
MTIYNGFGGYAGGGTVLSQVIIPATNISQNSYTPLQIDFGPIVFGKGGYSIQFTSATPQNKGYSMKIEKLYLTDGNTNVLSGLVWIQDNNTDGTAGTGFTANSVLADYTLSTTNRNYGNYRVNITSLSTGVTLTNSSIYATNGAGSVVTEKLSVTNIVVGGNASISGLDNGLLAVNGVQTNFTIGLNNSIVGNNSGQVTLNYSSLTNGTASARSPGTPTNISYQTIGLQGVGYRLATIGLSETNHNFGNYRIGDTLNTSVGLTNTVANDGYSEKMGLTTNNISANLTVSGGPSDLLNPQSSANISVGLDSSTVGTNRGSFILNFNSDGTGTSGFSATNIGSNVVSVSGVGFRLASVGIGQTNFSLGNFRVGGGVSAATLNFTNTAVNDGFSEKLGLTTNNISANLVLSGGPSGLMGAQSNASIQIGMDSSSVGVQSGSFILNYASDGTGTSGFSPLGIGSNVVSVSGTGYRVASAGIGLTNVNMGSYHLGATLNTSVALTNSVVNDSYSEKLGLTTNNISANLTVSGGPSGLMNPQSSANISVGMDSSTVGTNVGSFILNYVTDGTGTSGLSPLGIGSNMVSVSGVGYRLAAALVSTNFDLGRIHEGGAFASQYLTVSNTAPASAFSEALGATFGAAAGGATGSGSASGIAAGNVDTTSMSVGLSDNSAGTKQGTIQLGLASSEVNGSGLGTTSLSGKTVVVNGFAYTGRAYWNISGDGNWSSFANWDTPGGTPGLDGVLSTNDTATLAAGPTGGTTTVNLNGASPVLSTIVFSNTVSSYTIASGSGGSLTLGTAGYAGSISVSGGSHTISASMALARDTAVETTYTNTTLTISGVISGASRGVTKRGPGWLILSSTNTYTGPTVVNGGKLSVNGSLAEGAVTVQNGATLAGIGTVGGLTTIQNGGTLSPGNSPGIITFTNGVTFDSGSTLLWELIANTANPSQRGTAFDGINLTGGTAQIDTNAWIDLNFNGSGSTVSWFNPFWDVNQAWMVITNSNLATVIGTFLKINVGRDADSLLLSEARPGAYFYTSLDASNDLMLNYVTAVPEPSALALIVAGWAVMGAGSRRRHRVLGRQAEDLRRGSAGNQEKQATQPKFRSFGLIVLSWNVLLFSTGCGHMVNLVSVPPQEDPVTQVSYDPVDSYASEAVSAFEAVDTSTEAGALRAYFKSKKLLGSAYFACDEGMARHYAEAAGKCVEDSLRFYARDLEVMTRGQKPIHASVSWDFLKGAHEVWSASVALSGRHSEMKRFIDGNVGDAWALLIISRMARDRDSEEERRKLIEDNYSEIKEFLEREQKFAEHVSDMKRNGAVKKSPGASPTAALASLNRDSAKKPFSSRPARGKPAKTGITTSDRRGEGEFMAADPVTGKAAISIKVASSQPASGGRPAVVLERGVRSNQ